MHLGPSLFQQSSPGEAGVAIEEAIGIFFFFVDFSLLTQGWTRNTDVRQGGRVVQFLVVMENLKRRTLAIAR